MKRKTEKLSYCFKTPKYPFKAYIVCLRVENENDFDIFYPVGPLYTSLETIKQETTLFENNLFQEEALYVKSSAVLIPLLFDKLFPLKKEYFENPTLHYSYEDRLELFEELIFTHPFYKVVVTPLSFQGRTLFISAIPIFANEVTKQTERFMKLTDFPVDRQAKYAAIYTPYKPLLFNLETGETSDFDPYW